MTISNVLTGPRSRRIALALTGAVAAAMVAAAPAQAAGTDYSKINFAGRWVTETMTASAPLGNVLVLKNACGAKRNCYSGSITFHYQDGKKSKPIKIGLSVVKDKLMVVWPGGNLATGKGTSKARYSDGRLSLGSECKDRLLFASGKDRLPEQCVFLEVQ